jgi:Fic family protein
MAHNNELTYIWQRPEWPFWHYDQRALKALLADVQQAQLNLIHRTEKQPASARTQAMLQFLTDDVLSTSQIEGERLNQEAVRASIAHHLGIDIGIQFAADQQIDGIVSMVVDATINYTKPLTPKRLFSWHDALFPTSYSIISTINTESWRNDITGPMQVVSGPIDRQTIHFEAPPAQRINEEMTHFLRWFNVLSKTPANRDPLIKAGLAHLWFLTIHPFGDGNGRIARAINDMALARCLGTSQRFYSYSAQIQHDHDAYYHILEMSQKSTLDATAWLSWFLECLRKAIAAAEGSLDQS